MNIQLCDSSQRFTHLFVLGAERDTNVAASIAPEDEARGDEDACLMQDAFGEVLDVGNLVGDTSPEEHTCLGRVETASQCRHDLLGNEAA